MLVYRRSLSVFRLRRKALRGGAGGGWCKPKLGAASVANHTHTHAERQTLAHHIICRCTAHTNTDAGTTAMELAEQLLGPSARCYCCCCVASVPDRITYA